MSVHVKTWLGGLAMGGVMAIAPHLSAQDYSISWDVATSGGGSSSGGSFAVWDVVGQSDGGEASGGTFTAATGQMAQPGLAGIVSRVVLGGRRLFYNGSSFDRSVLQTNSSLMDELDDLAIATDKTALVSGQTASVANISNFNQGITGVMLDIEALPDHVTDADFVVRTGNSGPISGWAVGLAPSVSVRRGAGTGGSDRVTLTWPGSTFRNCWVEVRAKSSPQTGLALDDVFYFGNLVADVGTTLPFIVTSTDVIAVRAAVRFGSVPVTTRHDINRDGLVNSTDLLLTRTAVGRATLSTLAP